MQIQPADLAYRRRVLRTLVAVAILLLGAFVACQFWLRHISMRMQPSEMIEAIARMQLACTALIAVCFAALGVHLLVRGSRIARDRRFPPRDVRVVRDTPIREGVDAVRIARVSQACGIVCFVLALLVATSGWLQVGAL